MKRTGSIASRVPPAETTTRRPARSPLRASRRRAAATISSGSLIRPTPAAPEARCPEAGPTDVAPRAISTARLACVAACAHMWLSIAGAISSGAVRRQDDGRQQVVGQTVGQLRQGVGGGRRDDDQVGGAGPARCAE